MNGGDLKQKISFFEYALISDGAGGFIASEYKVLILETWASIKQIRATRTAENLQEGINSVFEIRLRQRAGFNPRSNYMITWDDKIFTITGIEENVAKENYWILTVVTNGTGI